MAILVLLETGCESKIDREGSHADRIRAAMALEQVPGLALATLKDCRVQSVETFGLANVESGEPVTESTLFEAASLSKQVFAYIYLQLVDRGALTLDEPLVRTFDYPRASREAEYAALTPRHILTQRSGLPNWARQDAATGERARLKFKQAPGSAFTYSGEGYQMLQAYLEARTGSSYEAFFKAALGEEMPLSAIGFATPDGAVAAAGYRRDGTVNTERPLEEKDALSLRTVVTDYARFASRLCRGEGLSEELWNEMLRPQSPAPESLWKKFFAPVGGEVSWGVGLGVLRVNGRLIHFQWGDNGVFKNLLAFDRESGDGVVYFANGENGLELMEAVGDPIMQTSLRPILRWVD